MHDNKYKGVASYIYQTYLRQLPCIEKFAANVNKTVDVTRAHSYIPPSEIQCISRIPGNMGIELLLYII